MQERQNRLVGQNGPGRCHCHCLEKQVQRTSQGSGEFQHLPRAWTYPHQAEGWQVVEFSKIVAWSLLVIVSFLIVAQLKQVKDYSSRLRPSRTQRQTCVQTLFWLCVPVLGSCTRKVRLKGVKHG